MDASATPIVDSSFNSLYPYFSDFSYYSYKDGTWRFKEPFKFVPPRSPPMAPLVQNAALTTILNDLLEALGDYGSLTDAASDTMRRRQCDQVIDRAVCPLPRKILRS